MDSFLYRLITAFHNTMKLIAVVAAMAVTVAAIVIFISVMVVAVKTSLIP